MSKHTPGPWAMPDSGKGRISKVGANGGWDGLIATADCGDYARSKSEGLANARLIAAAPDLLEALESAWLWMENQADGQSKGGHATFDLMMLREQRDLARAAIAKATGEQP